MERASLHVAAMPFPTRQGTQAAVSSMLRALASDDRDAHLLTYADGEPCGEPPFPHHRLPLSRWRARPRPEAFRSGPSVDKVMQDARMVRGVLRLHRTLAPDVVVAHHVEAMVACLIAGARPLVFFAHTALGPELPTYGPGALRVPLEMAGEVLDRAACTRADMVAAISPRLRDSIERRAGVEVRYVPTPWPIPEAPSMDERVSARRGLGLHADDDVILYAGNLDAYQGWEQVLSAVARAARRRVSVRLLVATASDAKPLWREARRIGMGESMRVTELGGEESRRTAHAAADLAVVPRRSPGGLPIKLLDSMARGLTTVTVRRATAGLELGKAAIVVSDDDPEALAHGLLLALGNREAARSVGHEGRSFVRREHSAPRFLSAMDEVVEIASARPA